MKANALSFGSFTAIKLTIGGANNIANIYPVSTLIPVWEIAVNSATTAADRVGISVRYLSNEFVAIAPPR